MKFRKNIIIFFGVAIIFLFPAITTTSPSAKKLKVFLIGIDGADWEMVKPLAKNGKLPNFSKLMKKGASAKINTNDKSASPVCWTSIATGQLSNKHGIKDFLYKDPKTGKRTPYTSNMRKTKAFWNILSEKGILTGIVGWYVTWPVEKVNGFMVSSYRTLGQVTTKGTVYKNVPNMIYPPGMEKEVEIFMENARETTRQKLNEILKPKVSGKQLPADQSKSVKAVKWVLLADEIYKEVGINLYKKLKPRVFSIYLAGIDVTGHRYTLNEKMRPDQRLNVERYINVHENYYIYIDEVLGKFIELADKNTIIMVVADHGLMRREHTNNGVFIAAGPNIKHDIYLKQHINLTDICPTLLYLLNLPVGRDMDGRVFKEAIIDEYLKENKVSFIDSYLKRRVKHTRPQKSPFDREIKNRLKSLGYL
jgi:predicted AlkP superfamily phosphohydrolase/phosphomutase